MPQLCKLTTTKWLQILKDWLRNGFKTALLQQENFSLLYRRRNTKKVPAIWKNSIKSMKFLSVLPSVSNFGIIAALPPTIPATKGGVSFGNHFCFSCVCRSGYSVPLYLQVAWPAQQGTSKPLHSKMSPRRGAISPGVLILLGAYIWKLFTFLAF